jgi:hypothetical protein
MLIRFVGPAHVRRSIGPYEWAEHNDFAQDVPADVAADLLTSPEGRFVVECQWEPLAHTAPVQATDEVFAALALAGIGSVMDMAALDEAGVEHVSRSAGLAPALIAEWASRAHFHLFSVDEEE